MWSCEKCSHDRRNNGFTHLSAIVVCGVGRKCCDHEAIPQKSPKNVKLHRQASIVSRIWNLVNNQHSRRANFLSYYPFAVYGNMEHAFNVHSSCDGWWEIFLLLADWSWTKHLIIRSSRRLSLKATLHRPFSWPGGRVRGGKSVQQIDSTLISVYRRNNWTPTRCLLLIMHIECKSLRPKRFKFFARLSGRVMYDSRLQTHRALWFRAEVAKLNRIQFAARLFCDSSVIFKIHSEQWMCFDISRLKLYQATPSVKWCEHKQRRHEIALKLCTFPSKHFASRFSERNLKLAEENVNSQCSGH